MSLETLFLYVTLIFLSTLVFYNIDANFPSTYQRNYSILFYIALILVLFLFLQCRFLLSGLLKLLFKFSSEELNADCGPNIAS